VLQVDDSKSVCQFNVKFGAALEHVPSLLATARTLSLNVVGISFHVGSGCRDVGAFQDAVQRARTAFNMGSAAGYAFTLLDCGGGFPGADGALYTGGIKFSDIAAQLNAAVEQHFPDRAVQVIAEPGRYFASSAMTLLTQVRALCCTSLHCCLSYCCCVT
jgi:ornithine decarboxylase